MTDDALRQELLRVFREESDTLLDRLHRLIIELSNTTPSADDSSWRRVERCLHTLKGAAEALGGQAIAREAHAAEDRIRRFIQDAGAPEEILEALRDHAEQLREAVAAFIASPRDRPEPEPAPPQPETAQTALTAATVASAAPPAARSETAPPETAPPAAPPPETAPAAPRAVARARRRTTAGFSTAREVLRVKPERVDELQGLLGELNVTRRRFSDVVSELNDARRQMDRMVRTWRGLEAKLRPVHDQLPRGARWSLEEGTRTLGGILRGLQTQLTQLGRDAHSMDAQATATTLALEDGIQELRLMELEPFLELFHPSVREAADASGCQARLVIEVRGTELDRVVLLKLRDPLLHLVRNAVAHGIESPEERSRAGKPELGVVRLEAETEGSRAQIRVSDDGRGVDVERVRAKAKAAGLIQGDEELGEAQLLELLLQPGFSSKESVDTLAGRGIGMDVVGSVVRGLDGQLTLTNRPGEGCTFTLDVPISASSGRGLVVRSGEHLFAFLTHGVERVVRLGPEDIQTFHGQSAVVVEDSPVALARLSGLLDLPAGDSAADEKLLCLVLRQGTRRLGVLVDDIPGEEDLQLKPLGEAFAGAQLYLGGAVRADGRVVPVLQTAGCLDRAARLPGFTPAAREDDAAPRLLVVDDSLTMRTLLRNILTAAGYQVTLANDGQHALEVLAGLEDCALVLADLEMPRLNGFELCAAIRRGDRPHTPVLVISSLASAGDIQRALDAGADSYIVKAELRQTSFLDRVAELTGREAS